MTRVNIHAAKTNLSRLLLKVEKGESVVLCRRNVAVAEIRPIASSDSQGHPKRSIGLAKGKLKVPKSFFEPLPKDVLKGFSGL